MINQGTFHRLEDAVDRFEETWSPQSQSQSQIEELLLEYELAQDDEAIAELIRIDIELRYENGLSIELHDYFDRFASLLDQPERVAEIAFEDYRSRSASGRNVSPARWRDLPGVKRQAWFQELSEPPSKPPIDGNMIKPPNDLEGDPAFAEALHDAGFHLVQQIGEGAFSRVYLANQSSLADRFVVLKIVSQTLSEPERMAVLQHTNIVPIFSFHRILSRSLICMPYAGCVTLNDFLHSKQNASQRGGQSLITTVRARMNDTVEALQQQVDNGDQAETHSPGETIDDPHGSIHLSDTFQSLNCVELANWLFQRLAGALAHAHARGILHNDLKPSNVLIRSDGEPALLDFNLSQTIGGKSSRHVGGTLPYMSPETYRAMMGQDARPSEPSDIYGLGVMLFEFVTGRLPYPSPTSTAPSDLEQAIASRRHSPDWRAEDIVTPGLKAIVNQCLEFEPTQRYETADDLQFDLQCEQQNLSLVHTPEPASSRVKKWSRRHPRLVSTGLAALVLIGVLTPVLYKAIAFRQANLTLQSQADFKSFSQSSADFLSAVMAEPNRYRAEDVTKGIAILDEHTLLDGDTGNRLLSAHAPEDQPRIRATLLRHVAHVGFLEATYRGREQRKTPQDPVDLSRLDQLISAAHQLESGNTSRAVLFLESERAKLAGNEKEHQRLKQAAESTPTTSDSQRYLEAVRLLAQQDHVGASNLLAALADRSAIPSALRWTMLGQAQYGEGDYESAKLSFTQSIERAPKSSALYLLRGQCHSQMKQRPAALRDYQRAIELDATNESAWANAGLIRLERNQLDEALNCFNRSLELSPGRIWTLLKRANVYRLMGKDELADTDFKAAMDVECDDHSELLYRAIALQKTDPPSALKVFEKVNQLEPNRPNVLEWIAIIHAVHLDDHEQAIRIYSQAIDVQPENESALVDRALSYARLGRVPQALEDVQKAMSGKNSARSLYQAACVHALIGHAPNQKRAVVLLASAIRAGYRPKALATDPDLDSIRHTREFKAIERFQQIAVQARAARARGRTVNQGELSDNSKHNTLDFSSTGIDEL